MDADQRKFLLGYCGALVETGAADLEPDGSLGPGNRRDVEFGTYALEWLRSRSRPRGGLRDYLRELLVEFEVILNYEAVLTAVFQRESFVAAIADLG